MTGDLLQFENQKILLRTDLPFQKVTPPGNEVFPLVLVPSDSNLFQKWDEFKEYVIKHRQYIRKLVNVHGAVLFRGFQCIQSAVEFNDLIMDCLQYPPLPYVGGAAVRTNVYKGVFTSNESPPSELIPYHHEMAQAIKYPSYIFFYSDVAAKEGGETPILRSDLLYSKLPEAFRDNLKQKGLRYYRVMPEDDDPTSAIGRGWRSTFAIPRTGSAGGNTEESLKQDMAKCEQVAQSLNYQLEWLPNGNVRTISNVLDGIKVYNKPVDVTSDHSTNVGVFFNSMVAAYVGWRDSRNVPTEAIKYGDGSSVGESDIKQVLEIMRDIEVVFKWEKGDVLLIDNHLVMHSRKSFVPPRRVLAYVAI
ncbi:hypothetical protein MP228_003052 [Amoeboaphelidium protococcarum]|nr:hypothetical protein MP228_003052 [Amoeboaphelidium protococcarum]